VEVEPAGTSDGARRDSSTVGRGRRAPLKSGKLFCPRTPVEKVCTAVGGFFAFMAILGSISGTRTGMPILAMVIALAIANLLMGLIIGPLQNGAMPGLSPGMKLLLIAGGIIVGLAFLGVLQVIVLIGESRDSRNVRGKYPPPVSRFNGLTAAHYGKAAKDLNQPVRSRACNALEQLGAEGVPYLLADLEYHTNADCKYTCLMCLRGNVVAPEDFPLVAAYLAPQYARSGGIRYAALNVIREGGPRAAGVAEEVRKLTNDPILGDLARETLAAIQVAR
jgi:hypothetical protein